MTELLFGLGLVFVIEGLVLALAPSRLESLLQALLSLSTDQRRSVGLLAVAIGVAVVVFAHWVGA